LTKIGDVLVKYATEDAKMVTGFKQRRRRNVIKSNAICTNCGEVWDRINKKTLQCLARTCDGDLWIINDPDILMPIAQIPDRELRASHAKLQMLKEPKRHEPRGEETVTTQGGYGWAIGKGDIK
jgi:choline kinase